MSKPLTQPLFGSRHLWIALGFATLGWLAMAFQEMLLFLRPNPFGDPYVALWQGYFGYALLYNLIAVMIASLPAMLVWLVYYRRQIRPSVARAIHRLQLASVILTVALDHLDNEVMRFMGIHLTYGLIRTYYNVQAWGDDMFYIIAGDRGGPGLPFIVLVGVPIGLWWAWRRIMRVPSAAWSLSWPAGLALAILPLMVPLLVQYERPPGLHRKRRVQTGVVTLYAELEDDFDRGDRPDDFAELVRSYRASWFQQSGDTAWRFSDPRRPMVRVPQTRPAPVDGPPWNIIFIQLETFRGWNTGFLRPDVTPSATPFLDSLARDTASVYWQRHLSFGPPTVSGFITAHCSVKPYSTTNITTAFTYVSFQCLPEVLRRHGYRAEFFTGFDPDWDNQTVWLRRWYDDFHYYDDIKNIDRAVFRRAADRIRVLGRGSQPFMASLTSVSNHIPFRAFNLGPAEKRFDLDPDRPPSSAIRNTMRYTDDVVRELLDTLAREPWFARTLVIITGDHGYDLGERGTAGQGSGWREAVWVPLVIHGAHPRLPRGRRDEPATLLDIAPTVTDLLGIRETTPWMGSSLITAGRTGRPFASERGPVLFGEEARFSLVMNPMTGEAELYDAVTDPLQQRNIASAHPEVVKALVRQARQERRLMDYLLEANLVWRDSTQGPLADAH